MTPIGGYERLSETEIKLFIKGHNKHLGSLKSKERSEYGLGNIVQVTSNPQENALDVEFLNGQKRLYTAKGARI